MAIQGAQFKAENRDVKPYEPSHNSGDHSGGHGAGLPQDLLESIAIHTNPQAAYAASIDRQTARDNYLRYQVDPSNEQQLALEGAGLQNEGAAIANASAEDQRGLAQRNMALQEQQALGAGEMANREMSLKEKGATNADSLANRGMDLKEGIGAGEMQSQKDASALAAIKLRAIEDPEHFDAEGRPLNQDAKDRLDYANAHLAVGEFAYQHAGMAPNKNGFVDVTKLKPTISKFYGGDISGKVFTNTNNGVTTFYTPDGKGGMVELPGSSMYKSHLDQAALFNEDRLRHEAGIDRKESKPGKFSISNTKGANGNETPIVLNEGTGGATVLDPEMMAASQFAPQPKQQTAPAQQVVTPQPLVPPPIPGNQQGGFGAMYDTPNIKKELLKRGIILH